MPYINSMPGFGWRDIGHEACLMPYISCALSGYWSQVVVGMSIPLLPRYPHLGDGALVILSLAENEANVVCNVHNVCTQCIDVKLCFPT